MTSLSNEQADYLLKLPKKILYKDELLDNVVICQSFGMKLRHELISENDADFTFLWEIKQSKKNSLRVSLHYQDNDSKIGLLRVDFNSGHKNPEIANAFVPASFHLFTGKHFSDKEHHVHYHVQGYPSLAWAVPLEENEFEVKELNDGPSFNTVFGKTINSFAKTINLKTNIIFNAMLL